MIVPEAILHIIMQQLGASIKEILVLLFYGVIIWFVITHKIDKSCGNNNKKRNKSFRSEQQRHIIAMLLLCNKMSIRNFRDTYRQPGTFQLVSNQIMFVDFVYFYLVLANFNRTKLGAHFNRM